MEFFTKKLLPILMLVIGIGAEVKAAEDDSTGRFLDLAYVFDDAYRLMTSVSATSAIMNLASRHSEQPNLAQANMYFIYTGDKEQRELNRYMQDIAQNFVDKKNSTGISMPTEPKYNPDTGVRLPSSHTTSGNPFTINLLLIYLNEAEKSLIGKYNAYGWSKSIYAKGLVPDILVTGRKYSGCRLRDEGFSVISGSLPGRVPNCWLIDGDTIVQNPYTLLNRMGNLYDQHYDDYFIAMINDYAPFSEYLERYNAGSVGMNLDQMRGDIYNGDNVTTSVHTFTIRDGETIQLTDAGYFFFRTLEYGQDECRENADKREFGKTFTEEHTWATRYRNQLYTLPWRYNFLVFLSLKNAELTLPTAGQTPRVSVPEVPQEQRDTFPTRLLNIIDEFNHAAVFHYSNGRKPVSLSPAGSRADDIPTAMYNLYHWFWINSPYFNKAIDR